MEKDNMHKKLYFRTKCTLFDEGSKLKIFIKKDLLPQCFPILIFPSFYLKKKRKRELVVERLKELWERERKLKKERERIDER